MTQFTKQDLLGIAKLSALELNDQEIVLLTNQVGNIIAYVDQLQQVHTTLVADPIRNQNILREDIARPSDADRILAQAPQREDRYFVVPKILD